MGFSGWRRPARASLIADDSAWIAVSWPKTTRFRSRSSVRSVRVRLRHGFWWDARHLGDDLFHLFDADDFLAARSGNSICEAPTSSITSMALSGSLRSLMYFAASSTAA